MFVLSQRTASQSAAHDAIREARARREINAHERRRLHASVNDFFSARRPRPTPEPARAASQMEESTSFDNLLVGDFEQVTSGKRQEKIRRLIAHAHKARARMGLRPRALPGEELVTG